MKISEKDLEVYNFIKEFILSNNVVPSIREICDGVGLRSTSSAHRHVKKLSEAGYIIPYGENSIRYFVKGLKIVEKKR